MSTAKQPRKPKASDLRLVANATVVFVVPEDNKRITFQVYDVEIPADKREYVLCDICGMVIILLGQSRGVSGIDQHRGHGKCGGVLQRKIRAQEQREETDRASRIANTIRVEQLNRLNPPQPSPSLHSSIASGPPTTVSSLFMHTASDPNPMSRLPTPSQTPTGQYQHIFDTMHGNMDGIESNPQARADSPQRQTAPDLPPSSPAPNWPPPGAVQEMTSGIIPGDLPCFKDEGIGLAQSNLPESEQDGCVGQVVEWMPGSIWSTYALQQHTHMTLPWTLRGIDGEKWIRVQSRNCKVKLEEGEKASRTCKECRKLANDPRLRDTMERAEKGGLSDHTPHRYLNPAQMEQLNKKLTRDLKIERLKVRRSERRVQRLLHKISLRRKILVYMSQNKIPAVSRLLARALRRKQSDELILEDLVRSASGDLRVRESWSDEELDTANLVRLLGGPKLLYALSRAEGYASRSTLERRKPIPEILASAGRPTSGDHKSNMKSVLGGRAEPSDVQKAIGQSMMLDDIALEALSRYDVNQNRVVGFCREHTTDLKTTLDTMEDVDQLEKALIEGRAHHASQATVVGVAPVTATDHYSVSPIVVSPSCNTETGVQTASWLGELLEDYHTDENGEQRHGLIWTIATDGAAAFRQLRHNLCHKRPLDRASRLGQEISKLTGINMQVGSSGIVGTCDPKHIIKRFATMLRSRARGITVNTSVITSDVIYKALVRVAKLPEDRVKAMLNPMDKQNVPVAVSLIESLMQLPSQARAMDPEELSSTGLTGKIDDIGFIAQIFGFFTRPFTDVTMTISQQVRSLSTYAHLLTFLYRQHGSDFITTPLYADSQAVVKSIIITAARLQLIDKNLRYYILFEGTDRLEGVFSSARTHDHARNFDTLQLTHKLAIGAEINAIYERLPNLDPGHKRLNLSNAKGVDHVNPASWIGDVRLSTLDLDQEYFGGRADANALIMRFYGAREFLDFEALFAKPNHDHLRPEGEYIGVKHTDKDVEEEEVVAVADAALPFAGLVVGDGNGDGLGDGLDVSEFDEPLTGEIGDEGECGDDEVEPVALNGLGAGTYDPSSRITAADGVSHSKHTLVAQRLASLSLGARKSVSRTQRVQGITKDGKKATEVDEAARLQEDDAINVSDVGVVLAHTGQEISLCVAQVLNFRQGSAKTNLASVPFDDLHNAKKAITIAVQYLELRSRFDDADELCWTWTGHFLQIAPVERGRLQPRKNFATRIAADRFFPISPKAFNMPDGKSTWIFKHKVLQEVMEEAWGHTSPDSNEFLASIKSIPIVDRETSGLPFRFLEQTLSIASPQLLSSINKHPANTKLPCKLCPKASIPIQNMRNHVSFHVLKAHRNVRDPALSSYVEVGFNPCGWCGLSGCKTQLTVTDGKGGKKKYDIDSDCEYHWSGMNYEKANVYSRNSPATNRPILCTLCTPNERGHLPTFWKFNFYHHLYEFHKNEDGSIVSIPPELRHQVYISQQEEQLLGIQEDFTRLHRSTFGMPGTSPANPADEGAEEIEEQIDAAESCTPARADGLFPVPLSYPATPGRKRAMSSLSHDSNSPRRPSPVKKLSARQ